MDRFERFFDDDSFRGQNDPLQDMEDMQHRMREMMESGLQDSFTDSWDGWFSRRFHKKVTVQRYKQKRKKIVLL